jgi:hypothetical protein
MNVHQQSQFFDRCVSVDSVAQAGIAAEQADKLPVSIAVSILEPLSLQG